MDGTVPVTTPTATAGEDEAPAVEETPNTAWIPEPTTAPTTTISTAGLPEPTGMASSAVASAVATQVSVGVVPGVNGDDEGGDTVTIVPVISNGTVLVPDANITWTGNSTFSGNGTISINGTMWIPGLEANSTILNNNVIRAVSDDDAKTSIVEGLDNSTTAVHVTSSSVAPTPTQAAEATTFPIDTTTLMPSVAASQVIQIGTSSIVVILPKVTSTPAADDAPAVVSLVPVEPSAFAGRRRKTGSRMGPAAY